jgi:cation diffusion facilitator family transporter
VAHAVAENRAPPGVRSVTAPRSAADDRRRLAIAFGANLTMAVVGLAGWWLADSTGVLGDAFDMLADASGYLIAWLAIGRSRRLQAHAARWNGAMLVLLGAGVLAEVVRRWSGGSDPRGPLIMAFAALSLAVNGGVLRMLRVYRDAPDPHLRATWIDTRADVLVNLGVLVSGALIAATGWRLVDLVTGAAIGVFVIGEGIEIVRDAGRHEAGG